MNPNIQQRYFDEGGRPTIAGMELLEDMVRRLDDAESKIAAIAAVADPSGGTTVDSEARAAIVSIIGAAG